MSTKSVAVIGSLNIDFVTRTSRIPAAGETLAANSFNTGLGGKGANQAVACARLASPDVTVCMVGSVGDDSFGIAYVAALEKEGIDASSVRQLRGKQTGVTNIIVEEETGENRILFVPNANHSFTEELESDWNLIPSACDVLVFQLEIPLRVVLHNMQQARKAGKHTVFNPAPAQLLPDFVYQDMDTLIMNETESNILAGPIQIEKGQSKDRLLQLAQRFLVWGVRDAVIITLGERGLIYATASGSTGEVPAHDVRVVDTTAAGDTFVGAYAVQRARQLAGEFDYKKTLEFATLAASKTVQKPGAMDAIPRLNEL